MSKYGGNDTKCNRCNAAVYANELQTGPGGNYHKKCYNCKECSKKLDSTNVTEKQNDLYCKNCYGRLFGPKGYGYGNTLSTETSTFKKTEINVDLKVSKEELSKPISNTMLNKTPSTPNWTKFKGTNTCPSCEKQVYFAEQALGPGGLKYHKMCFKCTDCRKMLDSNNMADKDSVMYCRPCHSKNFGPKGYGYGGAITL